MKIFVKWLSIICLAFLSIEKSSAQTVAGSKPKSQFIGLFVNNLDSTLSWYIDKLGFKIIDRHSPDGKIKFAMIQWNDFWVEMIEHPKVVSRRKIKDDSPGNIGAEGFFKTGFYVDDIEYWEKWFKDRNVKIKYPLMNNEKFKMKLFIIEDPEGNMIQFYTLYK